jgi:chromate transporter
VVAGLVAATGLKLASALNKNVLGRLICAVLGLACFIAIGVIRLPLGYVIVGLGGIACALAYRKLAPQKAAL